MIQGVRQQPNLICIRPACSWKSRLPESFDALLAEGDLQDAKSIERNHDASSVRDKFDVRWVSIAGSHTESVSRSRCALDRWRQHSGGGTRCFARTSLTYQHDRDSVLG